MKKMELKDYLAKIAIELGVTFDEDKAVKFITYKARAVATNNCAAVSDETVGLWFREFLELPVEEKPKPKVKEAKHDERQIGLELFDD